MPSTPELATFTSGATDAVAVTKSDSTEIPLTRGLYVGTGGDLSVIMQNGTTAVWKNVPSGSVVPLRCTKVLVATTAADILALY